MLPAAACSPTRRCAALRDSGDGAARIALTRFFAENITVQAAGLERSIVEGADSITSAQAALTE